TRNTLAPDTLRFICPWARSTEEGYAVGGNKFDLTKWDTDYFSRLKNFVEEAGKRDIVVELDLFSNFYDTLQWKLSPLYFANNINGIGNIKDQKEILSLRHPEILDVQEQMVRKIVDELKDFDNLYYEVCNEPYFGDTTALREWEVHMTGVMADAEKGFVNKHLISNNVANHRKQVPVPRKAVSIYNFHYARPPVTVAMNYHLNMPLGDNETGFAGIRDATYRMEAWNFILAGGALFNHLDYSFTTDNEDGTNVVMKGEPGGGSKTLRNQFRILMDFMQSLNYVNMKPVGTGLLRVTGQENTAFQGLMEENKVIALYFSRKDTTATGTTFEMDLPAGSYNINWTDTKRAGKTESTLNEHPGGRIVITSPAYVEDIALKVVKVN
ncbi:MAG: cellulase family glycosylhydrolase, partial [Bacteroidales bacterium]